MVEKVPLGCWRNFQVFHGY